MPLICCETLLKMLLATAGLVKEVKEDFSNDHIVKQKFVCVFVEAAPGVLQNRRDFKSRVVIWKIFAQIGWNFFQVEEEHNP